ncbi:TPA: hypothetical protein R4958_001416 [Campylobacter jejuni]|nr:hypothetical protein [Campylobacter jejuni]
MKPLSHQIEKSKELYELLKNLGYAYLAGKPRSGKTLTAILTCEMCNDNIQKILVLTKKNAIEGWNKVLDAFEHKKNYTVTNYEQVAKLSPIYDFIIIDESHNIGTFPRPSQRYMAIKKIAKNIPHLHLSGTAIIESPCGIFHQMHISKYSPFPYRTFYDFHAVYGEYYTKFISGRQINCYDKAKPELLSIINKFTVYMTQESAGISSDLQAKDKTHYIELSAKTKQIYNDLLKKKVLEINGRILACDTTMKLRIALHQIEGGTIKIGDEYIDLDNKEKVDYIKRRFGDFEDVGIMCHFREEANKLRKHFSKAKIYSSSAHAEGVDLSNLRYFIIYSSDYSGAKFVQRRERIININGSKTLYVHHLLVRKAISDQVYKAVKNKMDFNNSTYMGLQLD